MDFKIVTDNGCNLVNETIEEFDLTVLPLTFLIDGVEYEKLGDGGEEDIKHFYKLLRDGKVITTSLPNIKNSEDTFRKLLDEGNDVLYIGFSSGISGTYESTAALLDELATEYPERKILHADTFAAAGGQGLIVYQACLKAREGATIEETHQWVEDHKFNSAHWFTVDDLMFLYRGGRLSRTSAWAGSLLNIKPVLHVDEAGKLIVMEKVRSRKKSVLALFKHMKETALQPVANQTVFINHGDCEEDALFLAEEIRRELGCTDIRVSYLTPFIGAHSGPGTLALFYMGTGR